MGEGAFGGGGDADLNDEEVDEVPVLLRDPQQNHSTAMSTTKLTTPTMIPPTSSRRIPVSVVVGGVERTLCDEPKYVACACVTSSGTIDALALVTGRNTSTACFNGAELRRTGMAGGIGQSFGLTVRFAFSMDHTIFNAIGKLIEHKFSYVHL